MGLFVRAEIDRKWAEQLTRESSRIKFYNNPETVTIVRDVDLRQLGGLTVVCIDRARLREEIEDLRRQKALTVMNLAFAGRALLTTTAWLADAARAANPELATSLTVRDGWMRPMHEQNELWALPLPALRVLETEGVMPPSLSQPSPAVQREMPDRKWLPADQSV